MDRRRMRRLISLISAGRNRIVIRECLGIADFQLLGRPEFRNYAERTDFSVRFGNCNRDGVRVDTNQRNRILDMRSIPVVCGSAPLDSTLRNAIRATANRWRSATGLFYARR